MEALAGLASKEDFASVPLKKSSDINTVLVPFKSLMLLQVKGRKHVQTRLVEPVASSVNQGDNFILVTSKELYHFIGNYSNYIEQSRASDVVHHIQQTGDLGCKSSRIITINGGQCIGKDSENFWKLLGCEGEVETIEAGHPDEDELYENNIASTNMFYKLENNELVPIEKYWGKIPKIDMLESNKIVVLDFGSEMYVWSGKTAPISEKKLALNLAKEMWNEGYNYTDCGVCPLNIANILGRRGESKSVELKSENRPSWALFAKLTQHRETILFREKFLDWPDFTRIIKLKSIDKSSEGHIEITPCNAEEMLKFEAPELDFEVDGSNLGRGREHFDLETSRHFQIKNLDVKVWSIFSDTYEEVDECDIGHFYDCDTYIIRWKFRVTVTGRELSGKPSKHALVGRDRCLYFLWLGTNSTVNDKGIAALLTVVLDNENARQIRVTQGSEPPVFLQLFNGRMVIHTGKKEIRRENKNKLYVLRGDNENETVLIEVPPNTKYLRSKGSFLLVSEEIIFVWHGAKSPEHTRKLAKSFGNFVAKNKPVQFGVSPENKTDILEVNEEDYNEDFLNCLENDSASYYSLVGDHNKYDHTLRLFHMTSVSGSFKATEILCPHRSEKVTPFPFLQRELYSASQPGSYTLNILNLYLFIKSKT